MKTRISALFLLAFVLAAACSDATPEGRNAPVAAAADAPAAGTARQARTDVFTGRFEGEPVRLTLSVAADGETVRGSLDGFDEPLEFEGRRQAGVLVGQIVADGTWVPVNGRLAGDTLELDIGPDPESDGEIVTLSLRRDAGARTVVPGAQAAVPGPASATIVNGQPVPAEVRQAMLQNYGLQIGAGEFWYDRVSGAWGLSGGPTVGYIVAGLDLGGPLGANASGGGTQVTVNGRVLHPYDLMALQMLVGAVMPGRYFLDGQGNLGLEGGPPLLNLVALVSVLQAQQRQQLYGPGWGAGGDAGGGQAGGGDNFWSSGITGAAGNESGGAGYVMVDGVAATYGM